jgi:S1-C subfamily serine protease
MTFAISLHRSNVFQPTNVTSGAVASVNMIRAYNAASGTVAQVGDGSGVIIGRRGYDYYVLTNAHVVRTSLGGIRVVMPDGTLLTGKVVKTGSGDLGRGQDLAIVVVTDAEGKGAYSTARIGRASPHIGSTVLQAGYPSSSNPKASQLNGNGRGGQYLVPQISEFRGNSLEGGYNIGLAQNLGVGCSGGGLFDANGNLIGISGRAQIGRLSAKLNNGLIGGPQSERTVGWSISSDQIRSFSRGVVPGF